MKDIISAKTRRFCCFTAVDEVGGRAAERVLCLHDGSACAGLGLVMVHRR